MSLVSCFQLALYCVQRTIRNFLMGKAWAWWQLWLGIKPNLRSSKFAEIKVRRGLLGADGFLIRHKVWVNL